MAGGRWQGLPPCGILLADPPQGWGHISLFLGGCSYTRSRLILSVFAVLLLLVLFLQVAAFGAELKPIVLDPSYNHDKFETQPVDSLREFRAYTVSFDGADDDNDDGTPDKWAIPHWVAYQIKEYPGDLGAAPRRPDWMTDNDLHQQGIAAKDASYTYSRQWRKEHPDLDCDRGHMCRKLHAFRLGANADWNTHTLLNACPQHKLLNQGIWLDLEDKTSEWADRYGSVWVICGPVVYNQKPTNWFGEEDKGEMLVVVPDAFFKIVVRERANSQYPRVLAFLYPQLGWDYKKTADTPFNHLPYLTSVDTIEALTGLDFLTTLDDDIEIRVERKTATRLW